MFIFKFIFMALTLSNASQKATYSCNWLSIYGGINVGEIQISGNPITNVYNRVTVKGVAQRARAGTTDQSYLYLYNQNSEPTYALEVVNFPVSFEKFYLSVYGPDHLVLGSLRIARYHCNRLAQE
jgi:hypothetical protein